MASATLGSVVPSKRRTVQGRRWCAQTGCVGALCLRLQARPHRRFELAAFVHGSGKVCERPFWLEERGTSGDITDTFGVCDCGEERSLYEALGPNTNALGVCDGRRPWIGQYAQEACGERYRLLVRTASNAYFPQIMSVISLPEFDAGLADKVGTHYERLKAAADLGALTKFRMLPETECRLR